MKLLDNGWTIRIFKNQLGSYTAQAVNKDKTRKVVTDSFIPSQTLPLITKKILERK